MMTSQIVTQPLIAKAEPPRIPRSAMLPFFARRLMVQPATIELGLRLLGPHAIPNIELYFTAQGMDSNDVRRTLTGTRSIEHWVARWTQLAEQRETQAEELLAGGHRISAGQCFFYAASAYYFAQFMLFADSPARQAINEHCIAAYRRAAPLFDPPAERVEIPFRNITMPAYLRLPQGVSRPSVVININGTAMGKEQFYIWENEFLARGMATLSYDGPGSGEAWARQAMIHDYESVGAALLDWLATRPDVDGEHVALNGMSLGGHLAVSIAAAVDPRIRTLAVVSAPYNLSRDYLMVMPLVRSAIVHMFKGDRAELRTVLREGNRRLARKVRVPTLVVKGGRDVIVPPHDTQQLYDDAAGKKQMLYYPTANHACYEGFPDLKMKLADWLADHISGEEGN